MTFKEKNTFFFTPSLTNIQHLFYLVVIACLRSESRERCGEDLTMSSPSPVCSKVRKDSTIIFNLVIILIAIRFIEINMLARM